MELNKDISLFDALKKYFGFSTFKGNQEEIIRNVLEGRNTFVLMPTGGGKSLCYQLPALMQPGTAIINISAYRPDEESGRYHAKLQRRRRCGPFPELLAEQGTDRESERRHHGRTHQVTLCSSGIPHQRREHPVPETGTNILLRH